VQAVECRQITGTDERHHGAIGRPRGRRVQIPAHAVGQREYAADPGNRARQSREDDTRTTGEAHRAACS
jgi:hypothetical protein